MTIKAMSDKDYFADPAIDQSGLKQWMVSPAKYVASLEQPNDSPTLRLAVSSTRMCSARTLKTMP